MDVGAGEGAVSPAYAGVVWLCVFLTSVNKFIGGVGFVNMTLSTIIGSPKCASPNHVDGTH